jgi:hypothetical protein
MVEAPLLRAALNVISMLIRVIIITTTSILTSKYRFPALGLQSANDLVITTTIISPKMIFLHTWYRSLQPLTVEDTPTLPKTEHRLIITIIITAHRTITIMLLVQVNRFNSLP